MSISLGDTAYFEMFIGKRVLKKEIFGSQGTVPVYSANVSEKFGMIEVSNIDDFEHDYVLWGIDGNFEFSIKRKGEVFATTDHCGAIKIIDRNILPEFLVYQLELMKKQGGLDRTLRASLKNMSDIIVDIPTDEDGDFDKTRQMDLMKKYDFVKRLRMDTVIRLKEIKKATSELEREMLSDKLNGFVDVPLNNKKYFTLQRGKRVTKKDCANHPGMIPVISGRGEKHSYLGRVSEEWLKASGIPVFTEPMVTIAANGAVGSAFLRDEPKYTIHDDAIGVIVKDPKISPHYLQYALRSTAMEDQYQYGAKLYKKRLLSLKIRIPAKENSIDREAQDGLAARFILLSMIRGKMKRMAKELEELIFVE